MVIGDSHHNHVASNKVAIINHFNQTAGVNTIVDWIARRWNTGWRLGMSAYINVTANLPRQ